MKKGRTFLSRTLPCLLCVGLLVVLGGCSKESKKEDAGLRKTLQKAIKKTKSASSVHIEGTQSMLFETTDILKDEQEKKSKETYSYDVIGDYYIENDKINYYGLTKESTGYEVTLVIKDNKGMPFTSEGVNKNSSSSEGELVDYSKFNPFELYLNAIWIEDTKEYSKYSAKMDGKDQIITITIDDMEGLNESENKKYAQNSNASVEYYDFKLEYTIDRHGYISKAECITRSDSVEKSVEGESLGYDALVVEIKEKAIDTCTMYFTNYNQKLTLDFSLLEPMLKK